MQDNKIKVEKVDFSDDTVKEKLAKKIELGGSSRFEESFIKDFNPVETKKDKQNEIKIENILEEDDIKVKQENIIKTYELAINNTNNESQNKDNVFEKDNNKPVNSESGNKNSENITETVRQKKADDALL